MAISTAYLAVILIWSTTALAIQWSGHDLVYEFGVALLMVIGLLALLLISAHLGENGVSGSNPIFLQTGQG